MSHADVAFEDLVQDVDSVLTKLKLEIASRTVLESLVDEADDIIPAELTIYIEYQGQHFRAPGSVLGVENFTPLVEPLRRANSEAVVALVNELSASAAALAAFCAPPAPEKENDNGRSDQGNDDLLASLQRRDAAPGA